MNSEPYKIFTAEQQETTKTFFSGFSYKTLYFIAPIIVGIYLFIEKPVFIETPIIYAILGITAFYALLFSTLKYFSKKVKYVEFNDKLVTFKYKSGLKEYQLTWKINATGIELFELKDYKTHFEGLQINFLNKTEKIKLKLLECDWSYLDFEAIYLYFKERKNEKIRESEILPLQQLQLMNNSENKLK
ncbi:MAG: hypothetical protein K0M56_00450 [Kaistella sp.]|nr:hypothetical protein [Kaistella sp.]